MTRRCTWCGTEIVSGRAGIRIARTVCTACSEQFVFQMGVPLQTFLDSLPAPIFIVDDDVTVRAANREGYELLGKDPEGVVNRLAGVVFECAYARRPEGCGRTVHCSGCAIRRSVRHTYETGESLADVPATLQSGGPEAPLPIAMRISTEKMGNVILLRIDSCAPQRRAAPGH